MRKKIRPARAPGAAARGVNLVLDLLVGYWPTAVSGFFPEKDEHGALIHMGVELAAGRE